MVGEWTLADAAIESCRFLGRRSSPDNKDPGYRKKYREHLKELRETNKFILEDDVVDAAARACLENPEVVCGMLAAAEPPHDHMWLEWNEMPRARIISAATEKKIPDDVVAKGGAMISRYPEDPRIIRIWPWAGKHSGEGLSYPGMIFYSPSGNIANVVRDPPAPPYFQHSYLHNTRMMSWGASWWQNYQDGEYEKDLLYLEKACDCVFYGALGEAMSNAVIHKFPD